MKIKIIVPLIITLIIISIFTLASCFIFSPKEVLPSYTEDESTNTTETEATPAMETKTTIKDNISDLIKVISPQPNQLIQSPLIIEGEAKGYWFFEATFPVKLLDANGNIMASHYAEAQEDWMTEDFVAFIAQIEFEKPQTDTGMLVLEKNNPSGLPENDASIEIPVRFADTQEEYFTGAILKSIDIENNMITVEQLINDPDEIIIEPQVMLSDNYRVVKSILDIESGEEKSIDIILIDIPTGAEIGILFNEENKAELIIYQVMEEEYEKERLEDVLLDFFDAVKSGEEYKYFSSATRDIAGTEQEYKNGDKSDIYFIIQENHLNWENIEIQNISINDDTATVTFTGERIVEGMKSEGEEISFDFVKEDGEWKIDFSF